MKHDFATLPVLGLLHVADAVQHPINLAPTAHSPIDIYLRCAALCARSFASQGMAFTLVTNAAGTLRRRADELGLGDLALRQHDFRWAIPTSLRFHSAHYKLELIEALGQGAFGDAALLVDIDTVLLAPLRLPAVSADAVMAYDIGHEVLVHADWPVRADLEEVARCPFPAARWWGGEFLAADRGGFARLAASIAHDWPRYLEAADRLHHVGDEMLVSAALNRSAVDGSLGILDAGRPGGVLRWWSARTTFLQPPMRQVADRSLWHLPADKPFLARWSGRAFDADRFRTAYRRHLAAKAGARAVYGVVERLRGRPAKFIPRW